MSSFESSLEDFFSVCDQIEANLKTALEIHSQSSASLRYMTIPPVPNKVDLSGGAGPGANPDGLSYQQYLQTAKQQAHFTSETRNQLIKAAAESSDMVKQQQQQQQQQQQ